MALQAAESVVSSQLSICRGSCEKLGKQSSSFMSLVPMRTTVKWVRSGGQRFGSLQIQAKKSGDFDCSSKKHTMIATKRAAMVGYLAALVVGHMAGPPHTASAQASGGAAVDTARDAPVEAAENVNNVAYAGKSLQEEYVRRLASASKEAAGSATSVIDQVFNTVQGGSEAVSSAVEKTLESATSQ